MEGWGGPPTSVGILSLQAFGIQYMDLSDQLRVTAHPRPAGLRRLVQSQLSERKIRGHKLTSFLLTHI